MIKIIYQKRNGQMLERIRTTDPDYRVGHRTSMGWTVLDIQYLYKNKWYSKTGWYNEVDKEYKKQRKKESLIKKFKSVYNQLAYGLALLILFRVLQITILAKNI